MGPSNLLLLQFRELPTHSSQPAQGLLQTHTALGSTASRTLLDQGPSSMCSFPLWTGCAEAATAQGNPLRGCEGRLYILPAWLARSGRVCERGSLAEAAGDNSLCSREGEVGEGLSLSWEQVPGCKPTLGTGPAPALLCRGCSSSPLAWRCAGGSRDGGSQGESRALLGKRRPAEVGLLGSAMQRRDGEAALLQPVGAGVGAHRSRELTAP